LARGAHLEDFPDVVEEGDEHPSKLTGDRQEVAKDLRQLAVDVRERVGERGEVGNPRELRADVRCKRFLCRKPLAERLSPFVEHRCKRFLCREPLAEQLWAFVEHLDEFDEHRCKRFLRRKPLAERLLAFVEHLDEFDEHRCMRFVCREPLAEVPCESREALCTWFVCREPLAEVPCASREAPTFFSVQAAAGA
jgi:hypothetical protein